MPSARTQLVHVLLIALATALVYSNTLSNEFHLDDFFRVVDNPGIQKLSNAPRHFTDPTTSATVDRIVQYRPLLPLTLSFNYALHGEAVAGYHVVNILLQIVAAILVYFLVLELLRFGTGPPAGDSRSSLIALLAAALFAVHPVSGIAVNYISARDLLLMQVFLTGSLLAYVRMRRLGESALRWTAVTVLFALSMLAKQNGVVAPLFVLAFELLVAKEDIASGRPWRRMIPFAAVVAGFFVYTNAILGFSDAEQVFERSTSPLEYPLTQARMHVFHYLRNFVWPFRIRQAPLIEPATSVGPLVLIGALFIVLTLVVAWRVRRSMPLLAFCIVAYWLLMTPESSVLPLHHLAVDYRPYPSSVFLFLALGLLLARVPVPRAGAIAAAAVAIVACAGVASYLLNRTWRTEESLWSHSVRYGGDALAHLNLAMSIQDRADPRVRRHLEEALRQNPGYIVARINLGLWLIGQGETEAGLNEVRRGVAIDPARAQSHSLLARAYRLLGRREEAARASAEAARLAPRNAAYLYQAVVDAQAAGAYAGSLEHIAALERLDPAYPNLGFVRGFALRRLGRTEEAIAAYRAFLAHNPEHGQAHFNLGYALLLANRCEEAIAPFETALRLDAARFAEAHTHLATCHDRLGQRERAEAQRAQGRAP